MNEQELRDYFNKVADISYWSSKDEDRKRHKGMTEDRFIEVMNELIEDDKSTTFTERIIPIISN